MAYTLPNLRTTPISTKSLEACTVLDKLYLYLSFLLLEIFRGSN